MSDQVAFFARYMSLETELDGLRGVDSTPSASARDVCADRLREARKEATANDTQMDVLREKIVRTARQAVQHALDHVRGELNAAKAALAQNRKTVAEETEQIELIRTHRFYGTTLLQPQLWFSSGTAGKIARLQKAVDVCESAHASLTQRYNNARSGCLP